MKHLKSAAASIGVILALGGILHAQSLPIPQTPSEVPGPQPGPMTKAYVQMVARMAYVWGWPLMYVYNQRTELTKAPKTALLAGIMPIGPMSFGMQYYPNLNDPSSAGAEQMRFQATLLWPTAAAAAAKAKGGKRETTRIDYGARAGPICGARTGLAIP